MSGVVRRSSQGRSGLFWDSLVVLALAGSPRDQRPVANRRSQAQAGYGRFQRHGGRTSRHRLSVHLLPTVVRVPPMPLGMDIDREALADLCRRYRVAKLELFGSRAKGTARPDTRGFPAAPEGPASPSQVLVCPGAARPRKAPPALPHEQPDGCSNGTQRSFLPVLMAPAAASPGRPTQVQWINGIFTDRSGATGMVVTMRSLA